MSMSYWEIMGSRVERKYCLLIGKTGDYSPLYREGWSELSKIRKHLVPKTKFSWTNILIVRNNHFQKPVKNSSARGGRRKL